MAPNALIGNGFIGSILKEQLNFDVIYDSKNIEEMCRKEFGDVWCAAPSGSKWLANKNPSIDYLSVNKLAEAISTIKAKRFFLISTVDVLGAPASGNEDSVCSPVCEYGRNRRHLECVVSTRFEKHLIVRLPGIVGGNPKKGPLFDLKNNHEIEKLNLNSLYQWYPAKYLVEDCEKLWNNNVKLAHLVTPTISLSDLCFEIEYLENEEDKMNGKLVAYDVRTKYPIEGNGNYSRGCPFNEIVRYVDL